MRNSIHARMGAVLATWGCGLLSLVIAFGNMTDYGTNFEFVRHVLMMDTLFPGSKVVYRALPQPTIHHLAYLSIIATEALMAFFLIRGGYALTKALRKEQAIFQHAKKHAYIGICLGILLWFIGFIVIGGEWFSMWQSSTWNGLGSADRIITFFMFTYLSLLLTE
jgi:predicted small integral membrane protein